jgi:hypothetical protein
MTEKLKLNNVTLLTLSTIDIDAHIKALMYSSKDIEFGEIKVVTDKKPYNLPSKIKFEYTDHINNIDEWNHRIVYNLTDYVNTDYVILIHDDGFIVNPNSWKNEFLNYDYIGGAWNNKTFVDKYGKQIRVGNSVSLRSKKLLEIPKKFNMPWIPRQGNTNEDTQICVWNRDLFLDNGTIFADYEISKYFSHEEIFPDYSGIEPFCFHNFGGENVKYKNIIDLFSYEIN